MYEFYKDSKKDQAKVIVDSCKITSTEEELMKEVIQLIQDIHPEFSGITTTVTLTNEQVNQLRINKHHKLFILNYNKTKQIIQTNITKAKVIGTVSINLTVFSFILITFNRLLWRAIIDKAYTFKHNMIGSIYTVCREDAKCSPTPNWQKTKENKEKLLAKGLRPRYELEARTAEFKEEHYDGVAFVEKNKPFNVTLKWRRSSYANIATPDIRNFSMQLTRSNDGIGVRDYLKKVRDENKIEDLLIKYHKPNA